MMHTSAIAAGRLDRRITVQQHTVTRGALGGVADAWSTVATVWAAKRDLTGREIFAAEQTGSAVSTVFLVRWQVGINDDQRVVCEGKTYRIAYCREVGRHEGLELFCEAVNA